MNLFTTTAAQFAVLAANLETLLASGVNLKTIGVSAVLGTISILLHRYAGNRDTTGVPLKA